MEPFAAQPRRVSIDDLSELDAGETVVLVDLAGGMSVVDLGPRALRNVAVPLRLYALDVGSPRPALLDPVCRMRVRLDSAVGVLGHEGIDSRSIHRGARGNSPLTPPAIRGHIRGCSGGGVRQRSRTTYGIAPLVLTGEIFTTSPDCGASIIVPSPRYIDSCSLALVP